MFEIWLQESVNPLTSLMHVNRFGEFSISGLVSLSSIKVALINN